MSEYKQDSHASEQIKPQQELAFGAKEYVEVINKRIERNFRNSGLEDPLVVGLFGEWGCGKSLWLRHIQYHFYRAADRHPAESTVPLTLPVFFNAWRYETEEHLIVPLLKTAEQSILNWALNWAKQHEITITKPEKSPFIKKIREKAKQLGIATVAIGAGLKGKLNVPFLAELEIDPSKMLEVEAVLSNKYQGADKNKESVLNTISALSSKYFDFHEYLLEITGRTNQIKTKKRNKKFNCLLNFGANQKLETNNQKLNLLFLIDDLDRCLPEKAVQMLESIKLFLDVEGCAFVMAIDDEVVERGIAYRYRNYEKNRGQDIDALAYSIDDKKFKEFEQHRSELPRTPITGNEYLEKIVHLPVRIPQPKPSDAKTYLLKKYERLFIKSTETVPTDGIEVGRKQITDSSREGKEVKMEVDEVLLNMFIHAVPKVPRKLNRAAELLQTLVNVARLNGWDTIKKTENTLTLARLVILQLFAPRVYRFGSRHYPTFLSEMETWERDVPKWRSVGALEDHLDKKLEKAKSSGNEGDIYAVEKLQRPLLTLISECEQNRSGFSPVDVIDPENPSAKNLANFFHLIQEERERQHIAMMEALTPATPKVPERFVSLLFSSDRNLWRDAVEHEKDNLDGHILDNGTFKELLDKVNENKEMIDVDWVDNIQDYLSAEQLNKIYRISNLLKRMSISNGGAGNSE